MRLEGKVAIITGASPNIGGTVGRGFAREGAKVCINDLDPETADASVALIKEDGGDAFAFPCDVTDEEKVKEMVDAVVARWGHVDILVNAAVAFTSGGVLDMPTATFQKALSVICTGAFLCTKYVAASMVEKDVQGSIVCIYSTAAWQGQPGNIGYCTAKAGMINFVRSAAMELAPHGIRVNGFTPSATEPTEEATAFRAARSRAGARPPQAYVNDFVGLNPMGRRPSPWDYVGAFVYLASDESKMMTGTDIKVDSGTTAKYWPWVPEHFNSEA